MFKSEEAMKIAVNAIEQGVGADRWGTEYFFEASPAEVVEGDLGERRVVYAADKENGHRLCAIGLMVEAVFSVEPGSQIDDCDVSDACLDGYGISEQDIALITDANDMSGPEAAIEIITEEIGHVQK